MHQVRLRFERCSTLKKVVFFKSDNWNTVKKKIAHAFSVENASNSSVIVSDAELDTSSIPTIGQYLSMLHGVGRAVFGLHIPDVSASSGESGSGVSSITFPYDHDW